MRINNVDLSIIHGDIVKINSDAIVNPTSNLLMMNSGVGLALKDIGGQEIEDAVLRKGSLKTGSATYTKAGNLSAKYIIHAVTLKKGSETNEVIIRNACRNSLLLAKKLKLKSIAFPALGCGMGGFARRPSAKIMAQEIFKHAKYEDTTLNSIKLVLYDDPAYNLFSYQVTSYINHVQNILCQGPFSTADIIIELDDGIVLIERSNPPFGWALPGGFLDYGESLEACAVREAREETGLDICFLEQMHTYSDPERDPRFHTITTVFVAKAKGEPKAGDDAMNTKIISIDDACSLKLAFNHLEVLKDYKKYKEKKNA